MLKAVLFVGLSIACGVIYTLIHSKADIVFLLFAMIFLAIGIRSLGKKKG